MRLTKGRLIALIGALTGLVLTVLGFAVSASSAQAATTRDFLVTLYGWPDNSPPGGDIAYPKSDGNPTLHNTAGGVGTYANPITFATDKSELPVGTIVYYPYLHRYFMMEDDCTECDEDWTGQGPDGGPKLYHLDLWINGESGDSNDVLNCEDALTQNSGQVVVDPPGNEPVDTTPLFNSAGNKCYNPGSFKGGGGSGGSSPSPSPKGSHSGTGASASAKSGGGAGGTAGAGAAGSATAPPPRPRCNAEIPR